MTITVQLQTFIRQNCSRYAQTGQSYVFDCPVCFGKRKLYIRKSNGQFICFKCMDSHGFSGRPERALEALTGIERKDIAAQLYGLNLDGSASLDMDLDGPVEETTEEDIFITSWPLDYYNIETPFAKAGAAYLKERGISIDIAIKYKLRYCPAEKRVIFPVYSGTYLCGWQGRSITNAMPKIKSSLNLNKASLLMFQHRLIGSDHVVLCEGPIDAIKADLCGGNVATMGKIVSDRQLDLVVSSGAKTLYLALDPDADVETAKIVDKMHGKITVKHMLATGSSSKPDLGAMDYKEVLEIFKTAKIVTPNKVFIYLK
jgi:hypothetical protein